MPRGGEQRLEVVGRGPLGLSVTKLEDAGKLLLRLAVAGLMLFHGVHKVLYGIDGIQRTVVASGLPAFTAYGVYLGEVVAPLLVLVGYKSRPAGLVIAINMVVAIATSHAKDVLSLQKSGAWAIELQLLYLLGAVAVALLGPGRLSVSRGTSALG
jgi:putative oxidoreductase